MDKTYVMIIKRRSWMFKKRKLKEMVDLYGAGVQAACSDLDGDMVICFSSMEARERFAIVLADAGFRNVYILPGVRELKGAEDGKD